MRGFPPHYNLAVFPNVNISWKAKLGVNSMCKYLFLNKKILKFFYDHAWKVMFRLNVYCIRRFYTQNRKILHLSYLPHR